MWCVAELDEEYIARMEDVLAVYEKPLSAREPVVCIDEKPVVLHEEVRPPVAMQSGRVARRDAEYRRCGTANLFCGVQPKAGRHFTKLTNDRSSPEFADYLLDIAAGYRQCLGRRRIGDRPSLRMETRAWNRRVNRDRVTIQWSFTRKQARKKFGYTITRSRH
jgi:DDE superfamily endonuclease